jgi:glycosyltransferase involved in cell wall biosynthesis
VARNRTGAEAELVPPGVDTTRFTYRPEETDRCRVLYAGRIERTSRWKGLHVLVEAFAALLDRCPEAELHMVGEGDDVQELQALARRLGVAASIVWRGALFGDELVAAYHDASVVVLPSLTEAESFGMTLVEAMACGRVVVGSDVGGIRLVVRDGVDGLLVPAGDAKGLATALTSLLTDRDLRAAMGAAGHQAAIQRWNWGPTLQRTLAVLRQADPLATDHGPTGTWTEGGRASASTTDSGLNQRGPGVRIPSDGR